MSEQSEQAVPQDVKTHPLDLLFEKSLTLAERVCAGDLSFIDAVDMSYSAADWAGLVERYGDDVVQSVLAEAFIGCPRKSEAA